MTEISVDYVDGEPQSAEFYHISLGLMRFHIENGVATASETWNEITGDKLKEGYEPWVTTEDVVRAVAKVPGVESVEHPEFQEQERM